jgi:sulfur carrier protein
MQIVINGELSPLEQPLSIARLLEQLAVRGRLAVEVNGEIVPRSQFDAYHLQPNDTVEIVKAIGGG